MTTVDRVCPVPGRTDAAVVLPFDRMYPPPVAPVGFGEL